MDAGPRRIRFCVNNPRGLAERQRLLEAGFEMRDCLGRCSACFETRFVMLGTEAVEGESCDAVIAEARRRQAGTAGPPPPGPAHEKAPPGGEA